MNRGVGSTPWFRSNECLPVGTRVIIIDEDAIGATKPLPSTEVEALRRALREIPYPDSGLATPIRRAVGKARNLIAAHDEAAPEQPAPDTAPRVGLPEELAERVREYVAFEHAFEHAGAHAKGLLREIIAAHDVAAAQVCPDPDAAQDAAEPRLPLRVPDEMETVVMEDSDGNWGLSLAGPNALRDFYIPMASEADAASLQDILEPPDLDAAQDAATVACAEAYGVASYAIRVRQAQGAIPAGAYCAEIEDRVCHAHGATRVAAIEALRDKAKPKLMPVGEMDADEKIAEIQQRLRPGEYIELFHDTVLCVNVHHEGGSYASLNEAVAALRALRARDEEGS